jgi:polyhydroxyalkanoate synthase
MVQARVERWALDEFPLPGRLVNEIFDWLCRENRLCAQTLRIGDRILGPSSLRTPMLAVVNIADAVAPPRSIAPFIDAMQGGHTHLIEYPGEAGVGLQHLGAGPTEPPTETSTKPPLALPDKPSIAVLPFQNMSGDPDQVDVKQIGPRTGRPLRA